VRVLSDGVEGFGEGVPRSYVTGESAESAFGILREDLNRSISGRNFTSFEDVKEYLCHRRVSPPYRKNLSAFCALELALLDLSSKYWEHPLVSLLELQWNRPPPYSAVIPILPPDGLETFLRLLKKNEMKSIKVKVGKRVNPEVFEQILAVMGAGEVNLRVDANGAWTEKEALKNIEQMESAGVSAVEQPVAKENFRGLKLVTAHAKSVIIADESVCSVEDAGKLVDMGACHAFNIRVSKCGGLLGSLAVAAIARRGGLRCQIGCQVGETGILSAAGRHIAGWINDILYLEGSFGNWVLREDIIEEDIRFGRGGQAFPLTGNGLGVQVSLEAAARYARRHEITIP
jgi:muconate cycloisomerase